jgi:hypothetical protein
LATGAGVNDGRKIFGEVVGISGIVNAKRKWQLDGGHNGTSQVAVAPGLTVDRALAAARCQVKDGLSVGGEMYDKSAKLRL